MSEPLRIFLRLLGLVLFVGSLAGVVFIVAVGPDQVGEQMGRSCRHSNNGPSEWCTWQDVLGILQALPYTALVGGVLLLVMTRGLMGRKERDAAPAVEVVGAGRGRLQAIGAAAVVLLVIVNFAGTFAYRASYRIAHGVEMAKKIADTGKRTDFTPEPAAPKVAAAPKGLDRGSLLRAGTFRRGIAQIRRAAPAGARLTKLRVAADRIDAEVLAGGRLVTLRKPWDAKAAVVSTDAATAADEPIIAFGRLDPAAPQRVAVAAARANDASPRDVDYVVLQDVVGLRWSGFLANGAGQVTASPDGRLLH